MDLFLGNDSLESLIRIGAICAPPLFFALVWYLDWFVLYPSWFERQIRLGKKWVYVPIFWKKHKFILGISGLLARFGLLGAMFVGLFLPMKAQFDEYLMPWVIVCICIATALAFDFVMQRLFLPYRYKQQEQSYFTDLIRAFQEADALGQRPNEIEIRSRVSWEHQCALLKADENGRFLEFLRDRAKRSQAPKGHKEQ